MSLKITQRMNGKMKGFRSLNTSPIDNDFCQRMSKNTKSICSKCYSRRAVTTYATCARKPWKENGRILSRVLTDVQLPVITDKYFRFQSHGELLNATHYINLLNIAKKNPETIFVLPTKRKKIVEKFGKQGAENVILSYSEPFINHFVEELPPHFDRRFSVFTKEYSKENDIEINCGARLCMECLQCYKLDGKNIKYVNEHLK